jgi:plastocyanin domain-containing protein
MQALALLSGSFLKGGLLLFLFSLGTLPVLLLLGIFSRTVKVGNFKILQKTLGLIIILMAFYTISSGITIYKNTLISNSLNKENIVENIESFKDFQIVEMHIKYSGFEPNVIKVKKGIPVKWIIYGDEVTGCTDRIIVPSLNIKKDITSYETIIIFTPKEKGVIPFSCWMGMVRGKFIVE